MVSTLKHLKSWLTVRKTEILTCATTAAKKRQKEVKREITIIVILAIIVLLGKLFGLVD